jgi:hypothetical protein
VQTVFEVQVAQLFGQMIEHPEPDIWYPDSQVVQ